MLTDSTMTVERPAASTARVTIRNLRGKGSSSFTIYGGTFEDAVKALRAAFSDPESKPRRVKSRSGNDPN
jgi:hypothetical protein